MGRTSKRNLAAMPSLMDLPDDALLTIDEVAAYVGLSASTLEKWHKGYRGVYGGPHWIKLHDGEKAPLRAYVRDVRAWLDSRRFNPSEGVHTPARCA